MQKVNDSRRRRAVVSAKVQDHERYMIRAAASRRDMTVSDWLREAARRKAEKDLSRSTPERSDD